MPSRRPTSLETLSTLARPGTLHFYFNAANLHGFPYSLKSHTPSSGRSTLATPCPAFKADTRRSRVRLLYGKEMAWILSVPDSIKHAYFAGPDLRVSEYEGSSSSTVISGGDLAGGGPGRGGGKGEGKDSGLELLLMVVIRLRVRLGLEIWCDPRSVPTWVRGHKRVLYQ